MKDPAMNDPQITVERFRTVAPSRLSFLEDMGFHRTPSLEEASPVSGTVVYLGNHVGFIFSLDVRDQCVDAQVVKVHKGQIRSSWEGGYSASIFGHLVAQDGYRGSQRGAAVLGPPEDNTDALEQMVDGWANLLRQAGQSLLNDSPDSLPSSGTTNK